MKKTVKKFLLKALPVIVAVVFIFTLATQIVSGAEYLTEQLDVSNSPLKDFVVGPGKVELEIEPGGTAVTQITVTNRMGSTRNFSLGVEDFTGSRNPGEVLVLLGDDRGPYSLRDFLHFENNTFQLKNGERAKIPVRVTLPSDAQPGGLYGSILVSTTAQESSSAQKSAIVLRLSASFFVKVPGDVKEDGLLKGFATANNKKVFGGGPITFRLLYENNGSVHVNPYGEIRIKNMLGEEVGFVEVDPWFALPQSLRLREVSWDRSLLAGRYTATASINRGYGDIVDVQTISFWVLPWKIILGVFVAVLFLVFLLKFIFSRFDIKMKK